ncbi:MAG TPA: hypothetical protein VK558_01880 [Patescibacteria group bacterium]|nr:hypothetical protein [Patescibacteria group bacterium]
MTHPPLGEVLFEFRKVGAYVKVSAIDAASNTEVSIVGAANASQQHLKQTAIRKLQYVLAQKHASGK